MIYFITGFVELPDGKVLSGSDWGNMLLWEGGLIKVEISKKGKKTCHHGMIQQFFMDEGELMTIGADGFVKVNYYLNCLFLVFIVEVGFSVRCRWSCDDIDASTTLW